MLAGVPLLWVGMGAGRRDRLGAAGGLQGDSSDQTWVAGGPQLVTGSPTGPQLPRRTVQAQDWPRPTLPRWELGEEPKPGQLRPGPGQRALWPSGSAVARRVP